MTSHTIRPLLVLSFGLVLGGCGGGGGGGGGDSITSGGDGSVGAVEPTDADKRVITYGTNLPDGSFGEVDLVDGGNPDSTLPTEANKRAFFNSLITMSGTDYTGDGLNDTYKTGVDPGNIAALILGANNIYDLFQTTTGKPEAGLVDSPTAEFLAQFDGFTGGDVDGAVGGDATGDGGPGLFSNVPGSAYPKLPVFPHAMGTLTGAGSGRGPSATDQHQFIQIVFPYNLERESLFNPLNTDNSFLGDSAVGAADNVFVEARWVELDGLGNPVDQTFQHRHVSGVAIIGGVAAVPTGPGLTTLSTVDTTLSNLPAGCIARVLEPNVLTFIAHEDPTLITPAGSALGTGTITGGGVLVLPSPTASPGGGRVFGANTTIPGSVNDFDADADTNAAAIGFFSMRIASLRSGNKTIANPYFHSFPVSQEHVGGDPRAVSGSFNRGPALYVNETTAVPDIELLDPATDAIGAYNTVPASDQVNVISTRARFLVRFDREVVPNSVAFSRRHTLHSSETHGLLFAFEGNSRPVESPASTISAGKLGAPLAPSIYLAVNQPAGPNLQAGSPTFGLIYKVNSLVSKSGTTAYDNGTAFTTAEQNGNGLVPQQHNTLATLPRGVVPCDIYPLNQNNLNAFVVEPLVELPPGSIVTLGVCLPGLGFSVLDTTNQGNFTRSGTKFTPFQALSSVGLGEDASQKQAIIGNDTIIKVNAGPMDLQGRLFYGPTSVAVDTLINGDPADDTTTGGSNVCRTFRVGTNNLKLYVNAPVSPQALYLGFSSGGLGVLDLNGTGYTTNAPGGAAENIGFQNYLEVSRYLPTNVSGNLTLFNYKSNGAFANGDHFKAFGILGRYTAGGASTGVPPGRESELAIGAPIPTGLLTPVPGINEGSSGYETLVRTGIIKGDPSTSSQVLAKQSAIGIARDIEVGEFLDADPTFSDPENLFASSEAGRHRTYNTPLQGSIDNNSIADPPLPNPPPLRFPVGLPHTAVIFDQSDLTLAPRFIEGNEVFTADGFMIYDDGTGVPLLPRQVNAFIQLNPTSNASNQNAFDTPHLPNAGYGNPFQGIVTGGTVKFVQTGPMPKSATAGALILATLNAAFPGLYDSGGLVAPVYQSRQQIGNFLFVADGVNKKLHALNSNTMEVIRSLKLPDPYGLGLAPDLETLFVSNEGDNSLSVIDAVPTSGNFMTEIKRIPVGSGPRAVAVNPNNEDVIVLNYLGNTVSIVDVGTLSVRHTLSQNGIDRPYDVAIGPREGLNMPGFSQGTYHAYISNFGGDDVLVYESGPSGLAGIGFDNILGSVRPNEPPQVGVPLFKEMFQPRGITYDPVLTSIDTFGSSNAYTPAALVAHKDQSGRAIVTRLGYTKDTAPGQQLGAFTGLPSFGEKVFEVVSQYESDFVGVAFDVALPDFNRERLENEDFGSYYNLFNAGATPKSIPSFDRNAKFITADNILPTTFNGPRWEPDRVYLSVGGHLIEVFDLDTGTHLKTITTPQDVAVMATYFSQ